MLHFSIAIGTLSGMAAILCAGSYMAGASIDARMTELRVENVGAIVQLPQNVVAEVTDVGFLGVDVIATDRNGNSVPAQISWATYDAAVLVPITSSLPADHASAERDRRPALEAEVRVRGNQILIENLGGRVNR